MNSKTVVETTGQAIKESNKVLIQELIKDLEEKGIKPVIAVNGEVKKLTLIHERELQDFYKILEENGEEKNNFCVVEADKTDYSSTFYTKTGNYAVGISRGKLNIVFVNITDASGNNFKDCRFTFMF